MWFTRYGPQTSDKDGTQMWRWWPSSGNALNLRSYLPPSLPKLTWSGRLYIDEVPPKEQINFGLPWLHNNKASHFGYHGLSFLYPKGW